MKAISIKQPYAEWIRTGHKFIELRNWTTPYRGTLLVCSSMSADAAYKSMPLGVTVCLVDLCDVIPYHARHAILARSGAAHYKWSWILKNPVTTPHLEIRGQMKLFDPPHYIKQRLEQLHPPT